MKQNYFSLHSHNLSISDNGQNRKRTNIFVESHNYIMIMMENISGLFSSLDNLSYIKPPSCLRLNDKCWKYRNEEKKNDFSCLHRAYDHMWEEVNKQVNMYVH